MRVAAVQFRPALWDKEGNLGRLSALVRQAAEQGAELIVLPELCTTGYSFMSHAEAQAVAEGAGPGGRTFGFMEALSKEHHVAIAWGMVEVDPGTGSLYNSQVIVGPFGWTQYRKINLWGNDWLWAKPGRANPPIVTYKGKKVGLLVCRDVRDKKSDEWKSFYEKGDADIVCFSANWGKGGFPAVGWIEFAEENGATLVVSNRYGEEPHGANDFGQGGICVIYPDQRVVCEGLVWSRDCIVYAEV